MISLEDWASALVGPQAAVLVGGGASAGILPTWDALLKDIAATLEAPFDESVRAYLAKGKYLEAAESARMAIGDEQAWHALFERFNTHGLTTSVWNFVMSLGIPKIVTTNWDRVGSDSFSKVHHQAPDEHVGLSEVLRPLNQEYPHIIYPHGKAPRWDTIVFTKSEYARAEADDRYRTFWVDLLTTRPLLVVGFSGRDPAFQRLLTYVREQLRIAHLVRLFVMHPASGPVDAFGSRARALSYDDSGGHEPLGDLLRDLRDALIAERSRRGIPEDLRKRAGVPTLYHAAHHDLLLSMLAVDVRRFCTSESLLALTTLVSTAGAGKGARRADLVDATVQRMRVSFPEAGEAVDNAIEVARAYGWVTETDGNILGSASLPRADLSVLVSLTRTIVAEAQRPMLWTEAPSHREFIQDGILLCYRLSGARAAASLLGMTLPKAIDPLRLAYALQKSRGGIGDTGVEKQICVAIVRTLDKPPPALQSLCGRLANFAILTEMASVSRGREMLAGSVEIDRVYFDTNVLLPAMAPGHRWHQRCAALVERCRRHARSLCFMNGFLEELRLQYREAWRLATEEKDVPRFFQLALAKTYPNGFLEGYAGWASKDFSSSKTFDAYCQAAGLGEDVAVRVNGLGIRLVPPLPSPGRYAGLHARIVSGLSGLKAERHEKLALHEADQIVALMTENHGKRVPNTRFVTAHARLQEFVTREVPDIAAAVVPPVALSHLLAAASPLEIPPDSLRELAFAAPGAVVAEAVFGVLLSRWKNDGQKLHGLATEQVAERLRKSLDDIGRNVGIDHGIDARRRLLDVIETEVVPTIEQVVAAIDSNSPTVLEVPRPGNGIEAAAGRMAEQLQRYLDEDG